MKQLRKKLHNRGSKNTRVYIIKNYFVCKKLLRCFLLCYNLREILAVYYKRGDL